MTMKYDREKMVRKNHFIFEKLYPYMPVSKMLIRSTSSSFRLGMV